MKRLSAFIALPGFLGLGSAVSAETEKQYPFPACKECEAKFCRYKV